MGYHIGNGKIRPSKGNLQKLTDFPIPKKKKHIERLLGATNFNRKFIPGYAELMKPLSSLLSDKWGKEQQEGFDKIKEILSAEPALGLPNWEKEFFIQSNASNIAVGAMLFQIDNNNYRVILGYHYKTIQQSQKKWSATRCLELWYVTGNGRRTVLVKSHSSQTMDHLNTSGSTQTAEETSSMAAGARKCGL